METEKTAYTDRRDLLKLTVLAVSVTRIDIGFDEFEQKPNRHIFTAMQ